MKLVTQEDQTIYYRPINMDSQHYPLKKREPGEFPSLEGIVEVPVLKVYYDAFSRGNIHCFPSGVDRDSYPSEQAVVTLKGEGEIPRIFLIDYNRMQADSKPVTKIKNGDYARLHFSQKAQVKGIDVVAVVGYEILNKDKETIHSGHIHDTIFRNNST